MKQDFTAIGTEDPQRACQAAQHPVLIADTFLCQAFRTVPDPVPADDPVIVFIPGHVITKSRVVDPVNDMPLDIR